MNFLAKLGIAAFVGANARIFFRLAISSLIFFVINSVYNKYESLFLATDPEKLYIPLFIYTAIIAILILWTLMSLKWFTSFKDSQEKFEIMKSFKNKDNEYEKIKDVSKFPRLKRNIDKILDK